MGRPIHLALSLDYQARACIYQVSVAPMHVWLCVPKMAILTTSPMKKLFFLLMGKNKFPYSYVLAGQLGED